MKASVITKIKIGPAETSLSLFKATGDSPGKQKWETRDRDAELTEEEQAIIEKADAAAKARQQKEPKEETTPADPFAGGDPPPVGESGKIEEAPPRSEEDEQAEAEVVAALELAMEASKIERTEKRKGLIKDDGEWVDLTDQIEEIGERSKLEQMEVIAFLARTRVPRERAIANYYLGAGTFEDGMVPPDKFLRNLARSLQTTQTVAIVRFSKKKGQTVGAIRVRHDGVLLLEELVFAEQWRDAPKKALIQTKLETSDEALESTVTLIEAMSGRRDDLDGIGDLRAQMEKELAEKAEAGEMDEYQLPEADPAADPDLDRLGAMMAEAAEAVHAA